mmetsp:Transcript_72598/g.183118  ORF Transcript_72598/g.183118 Transcript_72598/m.183118 type:complete len:226 (-) Transcript_72598:45-722(-)
MDARPERPAAHARAGEDLQPHHHGLCIRLELYRPPLGPRRRQRRAQRPPAVQRSGPDALLGRQGLRRLQLGHHAVHVLQHVRLRAAAENSFAARASAHQPRCAERVAGEEHGGCRHGRSLTRRQPSVLHLLGRVRRFDAVREDEGLCSPVSQTVPRKLAAGEQDLPTVPRGPRGPICGDGLCLIGSPSPAPSDAKKEGLRSARRVCERSPPRDLDGLRGAVVCPE